VDNGRILDNYKRLWALSPNKLFVRIPVVPGYNAVEDELAHIARFLRECPPAGYELVPYHTLGNAKRAALDLPAFEAEQHADTSVLIYFFIRNLTYLRYFRTDDDA
jgi:pyruvate-formate lyase-activating enzyme